MHIDNIPIYVYQQVDVATKHIPYHMEKFGYTQPNVDFKLGYIENLKEAGIPDESCDLIMLANV